MSKPSGQCFVEIHLRQWRTGEAAVTVRDKHGNVAVLDGAHHSPPHISVLCELDEHDGVIELPGLLCAHDPSNAHPASPENPRKPHPAPHAKLEHERVVGEHDGGAAKPIGTPA